MSSLAWIDFDEAERQRAQRIMALFQERETRDELGLGAIRDSIADHLFPGTSTIQTCLRYMLFIPWLYRALENREVPETQLRAEARDTEIRLADALKAGGETNGIIGRALSRKRNLAGRRLESPVRTQAVVAARHVRMASVRRMRSVRRDVRWRWTLKVLWTAA